LEIRLREAGMLSQETLERMAREVGADLPLPREDWEAVLVQVPRVREALAALEELPLETVEPVSIYKVVP
jgi:hypothetical protein